MNNSINITLSVHKRVSLLVALVDVIVISCLNWHTNDSSCS